MPQEMTFGESLITALEEIMGQDQRVVLIGGGLVGTGSGQAQLARLRQKYSSRIKSPPIAELGFCGIAAGAAMAGLRPLVDIGTATFSYEAIPQIVNEAAIAYSNSGGQTNVPVTYFMRYGLRGGGGVQVPRARAAAETLAKEGISAEVVDPRTLEPLDKNTLLASVKKTGRVVVTDESHDNCSVAAGLAAIIADEAFGSLRAPIKRVT